MHWMARVACRCVGDVLLRVAVPLHAFWRRVAPEPSSSPQRRTGRSRGPPRGAGLCHVALPLCLHPAERHRKRCNACRRLLQKGHRGAHMARHAAARRGVRLAPWQTVRRARRVWNAAQPNTLSGLVARVACRVASWWGRFWSARSQAPSLQEGPRRTGAALVRAKVHPYLHAGWRCASSDIALPRIAHCVAFALLLKWCGSFVPAPWAILGAYAAVRAITTMTPRCHGPLCRFATTCSAAAVVAVGYGPLCAAVAATCLCTCPCSALWFAPKKLPGHRVSATTSTPGVRRKPAAAAAEADRPAPPVAAAAEAILQEVQAYMQANGGKLPSQCHPEAKKLYFKFRRIRSRPMPTPAAKALLQKITGGPGGKKGAASVTTEQLRDLKQRCEARGGHIGDDHASPGAKRARKVLRRAQAGADSFTPQRDALFQAISATQDSGASTGVQCWKHVLAHDGRLPTHSSTATEEDLLARRFSRLQKKSEDTPDAVSEEAKRLLRRILAEHAPLKTVLNEEQFGALDYRQFQRRHRSEFLDFGFKLREMPRAQKQLGSGEAHAGSSPFPWFTNVGHSCYLNSIVACLFVLSTLLETEEPKMRYCCPTWKSRSQNAVLLVSFEAERPIV